MGAMELRAKKRNIRRIAGIILSVLWAALIFILSSIPGEDYPAHPDFLNNAMHFMEYLILAVFLTLALSGEKTALWKSAAGAVAIAMLYAASDELHQLFVPTRTSSPLDWAVDSVGAIIGAAATIYWLSLKAVQASRKKDKLKV